MNRQAQFTAELAASHSLLWAQYEGLESRLNDMAASVEELRTERDALKRDVEALRAVAQTA